MRSQTMQFVRTKWLRWCAGLTALVLASWIGLWGGHSADAQVERDEVGDYVQTVREGELPAFARSRTQDNTALYRYAVEHGEKLKYIPCYCGCGGIGHTSNRACYMKREHQARPQHFLSAHCEGLPCVHGMTFSLNS